MPNENPLGLVAKTHCIGNEKMILCGVINWSREKMKLPEVDLSGITLLPYNFQFHCNTTLRPGDLVKIPPDFMGLAEKGTNSNSNI